MYHCSECSSHIHQVNFHWHGLLSTFHPPFMCMHCLRLFTLHSCACTAFHSLLHDGQDCQSHKESCKKVYCYLYLLKAHPNLKALGELTSFLYLRYSRALWTLKVNARRPSVEAEAARGLHSTRGSDLILHPSIQVNLQTSPTHTGLT